VINAGNFTQLTELARWGRGTITDIDLSADGNWLAVAAGSGVYIHDINNLTVDPIAIETVGNVTAVTISPNGDKVALVIQRRKLQVWQTQPIQHLIDFEPRAIQATFSADGEHLAIQIENGVELISSTNGEIYQSFPGVYGAAFSKDNTILAVWNHSILKKYDWRTNTLLSESETLTHLESEYDPVGTAIQDAVFLPNGDMAILAPHINPNGFTGDYEIQKASDASLLFGHDYYNRFSEPIQYACNEPIFYWDLPTSATSYEIEITNDGQIVGLLFQDSGFSDDYTEYTSLQLFDIDNGESIETVGESIIDYKFAPDGQTWIAGFQDGRIEIRRISDGVVLESVEMYDPPILDIDVAPDSKWIGVTYLDEVRIYNQMDGALHHRFPAIEIAFAPDGQSFALGYEDGRIEQRDIKEGSLINSVKAHEDQISALTYLPSGNLLSAGFDCNIIEWEFSNMTQLSIWENYMVEGRVGDPVPKRIREFIVLPDGKSVLGQLYGRNFVVWSIADELLEPEPNPQESNGFQAMSPNGAFVAVHEHYVDEKHWDDTIIFLETFSNVASFSPDSILLIDGNDGHYIDAIHEGAIRLSQTSSMSKSHEVTPRTDSVMAIIFSPDGKLFYSGALDGVVRVWGIP
jgi:WD40 repeat protein